MADQKRDADQDALRAAIADALELAHRNALAGYSQRPPFVLVALPELDPGAPQGADRNEIENVPVAAWDLTMGVNAKGAFLMSRAAVPAIPHRS